MRLVLGLPVADVTTGFCAFTRKALLQVDLDAIRCKGFVFLAELKYACNVLGLSMREVPFVFNNRLRGESKLGMGIVIEALWKVWLVRLAPRSSYRQQLVRVEQLGQP
jgi:dolichol-phosphate mannosyltransferase